MSFFSPFKYSADKSLTGEKQQLTRSQRMSGHHEEVEPEHCFGRLTLCAMQME